MNLADVDAQLFKQLALQGLRHGFTDFQLTAWKLPVTRKHFALGAGGEQEAAIGCNQHAHRHIDGHPLSGSRHA